MSAVASAVGFQHSDKLKGLARVGLAGRGAVYVLLGVLALVLAFGGRRKETDQKGAFQQLAQNAAGLVLLVVIAVALAAYALWRLLEAAFGATGVPDGDSAKQRAKSAFRGVVYVGLSISAFSVVVGRNPSNQSKQQQSWTSRVMQHTGGRWLVGIVGAVVVIVGIGLAWQGARTKFEKHFPRHSMGRTAWRATKTFGLIGMIARGIVVGMVGVLLITAAVQFDPRKARGVDGALRSLRDTAVGPWLLVLVAAGLVLFGLYGFCEARWRRV